jgi:xanthine dehydrogenase accessory factor
MQQLDLQVIERALQWSLAGERIWLCTVLSTYGSAPRSPGALLVANATGQWLGSLSGGCIEEDFLEQLQAGAFARPVSLIRYGAADDSRSGIRLPCGGMLEVLVENLPADCAVQEHLQQLHAALLGQRRLVRQIDPETGTRRLLDDAAQGARVERCDGTIRIRMGAAQRLLLAGYSSVSHFCAQFGQALGFEVLLCEPRDEVLAGLDLPGIELRKQLPAQVIASGGCHRNTAIVALTHDPRMDDLSMIEAVRTEAFYIGVMGSQASTAKRFERLARSGGLNTAEIERIRAPIGLNIGSRTPAEIALSVLADIVRTRNAIPRDQL